MTLISEEFGVKARELYGKRGEEWLAKLPELLQCCETRFGITLEAPFSNLSWNLVLKANTADGMPVVLKLGVEKAELDREVNTLKAYRGRGAIRVIDSDTHLGAFVLERALPGTPLSEIEDDEVATEVFCEVFARLHRCAPRGESLETFTSMKRHFLGIERYRKQCTDEGVQGPLPPAWVLRAEDLLSYLLSSTEERVLLHGDLHHDNILRDERAEWLVIDPKGIVGDRHFETIQYMLNHEERGGDLVTVLGRRIERMAQRLNLDPRRIAMWGIARGVLEACWTLEDGGTDWQRGIQISERFANYLEAHPALDGQSK